MRRSVAPHKCRGQALDHAGRLSTTAGIRSPLESGAAADCHDRGVGRGQRRPLGEHHRVPTQDALDRLQQPTSDGEQRVSSLHFGDPPVMALSQPIRGFRHLPRGFRERDLRRRVEALLGRSYSDCGVAFARIEVRVDVAPLPTVEAVSACAARERVVASTAAQQVVAGATDQCVIAILAEEDVRAGCAGERVDAVTASLHRDGRCRAGCAVVDDERDGRAARAPGGGGDRGRAIRARAADGDVACGDELGVGRSDGERQARGRRLDIADEKTDPTVVSL